MDLNAILTAGSSLLALAIGGLIKRSNASNKWIPWIVLLISFLNQVGQAVGMPTDAHAATAVADSVAVVAPHASAVKVFLGVFLKAFLQTFLTVGAVSFTKNGVIGQVSEAKSYFKQ